jgi:hypothetical protein
LHDVRLTLDFAGGYLIVELTMKILVPLLVAASALAASPSFAQSAGEICTPAPVKVRDYTLCRVVRRAGELQCRCKLVNVWQSRSRSHATVALRRPIYFSLRGSNADPGGANAPATGGGSVASADPAGTVTTGTTGALGATTGALGGVVSGVGAAVGAAVGGTLGRL